MWSTGHGLTNMGEGREWWVSARAAPETSKASREGDFGSEQRGQAGGPPEATLPGLQHVSAWQAMAMAEEVK